MFVPNLQMRKTGSKEEEQGTRPHLLPDLRPRLPWSSGPLTQRCPRTPRFLWGPSFVHSSSFHDFPVQFLPLEFEHTRAGHLADYPVPSRS